MPSVRRPYGADDCLSPLINVNMLDADMLVAAMTELTERLHLPSISSHQSRRRGSQRHYSALATTSSV